MKKTFYSRIIIIPLLVQILSVSVTPGQDFTYSLGNRDALINEAAVPVFPWFPDGHIPVLAETKKENNIIKYHFNKAELYENFLFDNLLENIENGGIMFDIRIGVHNSGKNFGKTHDHGSGFRVKRENFKNLYESFEEI